jgi:hypothetical protein
VFGQENIIIDSEGVTLDAHSHFVLEK